MGSQTFEPNKLLLRQIKRSSVNFDDLQDDVKGLLQAVNQSYIHFERDRQLLERAMDISSNELRESYEKLLVHAELERKHNDLEHFASIASHDLKAPLRMVGAFTQLLERELRYDLSNNAEEYLGFIKSGVREMELLIKNLLEFGRLGVGSQEMTIIDLNTKLDIVLNNLQVNINESAAQITVDDLPKIKGYRSQILQLFQNLIGNALKFRKDGCNPIVNINYRERSQQMIFSIQDNGIGIPEEYQDKIFEVFQRLGRSNGYEGSGLGLSICKKVVTNHAGEIWLESEEGIGTTFFFTLPINLKQMSVKPYMAFENNHLIESYIDSSWK